MIIDKLKIWPFRRSPFKQPSMCFNLVWDHQCYLYSCFRPQKPVIESSIDLTIIKILRLLPIYDIEKLAGRSTIRSKTYLSKHNPAAHFKPNQDSGILPTIEKSNKYPFAAPRNPVIIFLNTKYVSSYAYNT